MEVEKNGFWMFIPVMKASRSQNITQGNYLIINNMKVFSLVSIIILFSICGNCQTLKKERVTKNDRMKGIYLKFNYSAKDSYNVVNLILNKDSGYSNRISIRVCGTYYLRYSLNVLYFNPC
jgi:hypothetical protein